MGAMACMGMSIFGALFMGGMALMLKNDYQYMGEWYDTSEDNYAPYAEQKANAMHNCWVVAGIYLGFAVLSGLGTCYFSVRAKRS
ncbi:g2555 [Coccomyxa viridis]|uniref:G2555 protein n=1 Tax=Coccomyxa viridis TaxID=1274662 RepID=A0ABP1FKN7_9CHLO